ncbi:MAG: hypothetical protein GKR88_15105 [Flavobacteriaceae bacterium]|nr:MAG: hypothetical protein GKR88_14905 [Flavobacteriaceae bacterium]QMU65483.1 MAG: hypothetical protein GKR88_15105 [Flavobacteriaceae bacterium]
MVQDFSKEVFNSKEKIDVFLDGLATYNLNEDVANALRLLKKIDFKNHSVLLENLIEEFQVIVVSKSNPDETITAVFRREGHHKFYISGCKFCSNDFRESNLLELFEVILKGNYRDKILLKSGEILEKEVSLLNITRRIKTGWFNFFRNPDKTINKTGMDVLTEEEL